jgi:hypothetical protein
MPFLGRSQREMKSFKRGQALLFAVLLAGFLTVAFLSDETKMLSAGASPKSPAEAALYYWAMSIGGTGSSMSNIAGT